MIQEIHRCLICNGEFSDHELLMSHTCPLREGNEHIELADAPPERYTETAPEAGAVPQDRLGLMSLENRTDGLHAPETRLGNEYGGGDAAIAIGEEAFDAGWDACSKYTKDRHGISLSNASRADELAARAKAWGEYEPSEAVKALT